MADILLVEDDLSFVHLIQNFLAKKGHSVVSKSKLRDAAQEIRNNTFELILLDYHLPDGNAFDLINQLHSMNCKTPVVIMTSFEDVRTAVRAMHLGVKNYITKPVNPEELLMVIDHALGKNSKEILLPLNSLFIKGNSPISQALYKHIELIAPTNMSVIIQGESGTGKENIARSIHEHSKRSKGPFVAIDCGALSDELSASELFGHTKGAFTGAVADKKGDFETANGGTLFLDEVGNLSYAVQVKLLRAVQEREIQPVGSNKLVKVDVRIITATNDDLRAAVKSGAFREDLFHRLNEFNIYVPPLREREGDLEVFITHFITQANTELSKSVKGLSNEVMKIFKTYSWPGNLRELKNMIKRAVLLCEGDFIDIENIPADIRFSSDLHAKDPGSDLKVMNEQNEKELIIKTLSDVKFNKTKAAALLNIDRKTLYLKIVKYGIDS
jgi:two-component system, NtrC family, response regulator HydG